MKFNVLALGAKIEVEESGRELVTRIVARG